MLTMATYAISSEETNFARLTTALLQICSDLLREVLLQHIPNRDIQTALSVNKKKLKPILNTEQKRRLFPLPPATFIGSVADFDISLLYLLIRNISTVPAHSIGWGKPPCDQPRDCSIGANVERIRLLRNKISGHSVNGKVLDADFEVLWTEIEDCVQDLGTHLNLRSKMQSLAKLKIQDMDPAYATRSSSFFTAQLSDIQKTQGEMHDKLADQLTHLTDMKQTTFQLKTKQSDQLKCLTNIKDDTGQLKSQLAEQLKHLEDTQEGTAQIQSQNVDQLNRLTDIKQDTRQLQSQHADQLKHLTDIKQDTRQLQSQHADQLKHLTDIRQDTRQLQSQHADQLKHLTDIKQHIGRKRNKGTCIPFCVPCCTNIRKEGFDVAGFDLQRVRKQLINVFTHSYQFIPKNPFDPDSGTDIAFVYTELEIEDYDQEHGEGESVQRITEFEGLIKLPSGNRKATRIYLEGKAGSGKTVYASKLITDWCNTYLKQKRTRLHRRLKGLHNNYLLEYDICLPVSLHNVRNCENVEELVQSVLGSSSGIDVQNLAEYIVNNQERTLIVMDGLDEYGDNCPVVDDIMQRKALPFCTVVITSRPWKIQNLLDKGRYVDRKANILGFSEDNTLIYAQKVFRYILGKSQEASVTLSNDLKNEIKRNHLVELSKLPLILLFMCYLWTHEKKLSDTETGIYISVVKCLVGNYAAKKNVLSKLKGGTNLKNIKLDQKRELFITMGTIAYRGLISKNTKEEMLFDEDYLNENFNSNHIQEALRIGLLSEQKSFSAVCTTSHLSFPHKSIQEFFAAYLFVHSQNVASQARIAEMIDTIEAAENFENVLKFIVGIGKNKDESGLVLTPLAARCLILRMESDDSWKNYLNLFWRLTGELNTRTEMAYSPTLFDVMCDYCFQDIKFSITCQDWIDLFSCISPTEQEATMKCCAELHTYLLPLLVTLTLDGVMLGDDWQGYFVLLSSTQNVQSVTINRSNWYRSEVKIPALPALKMLRIYEVEMTHLDIRALFTSLSNAPNLEIFDFAGSPNRGYDLRDSLIQVTQLPVLKTLAIQNVKMGQRDCNCLFASLSNVPNLENLVLTAVNPRSIDMTGCQIKVPRLPELKKVDFTEVAMNPGDWKVLFASLVDNTSNLETVSIWNCSNMCGSRVEVSSLYMLQILEFFRVGMLPEDWKKLVHSLDNLTRIHTIKIKGCRGWNCSKVELPHLPNLTEMDLTGTTMSSEDAQVLKDSLLNAPKLHQIKGLSA